MIREPGGVRSPPWFFIGVVLIVALTTFLISKWIFGGSAPPTTTVATNQPPRIAAPPSVSTPAPTPDVAPAGPQGTAATPTTPTVQSPSDAFAASSYQSGVTIVGVRSQRSDAVSVEATKQLLDGLFSALGQKGREVDEFRPAVYASNYFDQVLNGDVDLLSRAGLIGRMHAAMLTGVEAECHDSTALAGAISCTMTTRVRIVGGQGRTSFLRFTQIGAGSGTAQALNRTVELLLQQHPEILSGI